MDPNALLEQILILATDIISDDEEGGSDTISDAYEIPDGLALAQAVCNLSHWLDNGGFLPKRWKHAA